jgi:hypothetical protein
VLKYLTPPDQWWPFPKIEDKESMTENTPAYEVPLRKAQAAVTVLFRYVEERKQAVEKEKITNPTDAVKLMSELYFLKEELADRAKSPLEKLYDTLRFTTVPNVMDGQDLTTLGVEGVGKVHLQDDVTVKTEDKEALFKWLTDHELEDMITEQVNAQTLAAFVRKRIREAAEKKEIADLPSEKVITIKPIVRAVINRS